MTAGVQQRNARQLTIIRDALVTVSPAIIEATAFFVNYTLFSMKTYADVGAAKAGHPSTCEKTDSHQEMARTCHFVGTLLACST